MKNYDGFIKMNEGSNELALLSNLYSFFLQKYGATEIAKAKFQDQAWNLLEKGEISKKSITKFFKENDMEKEVKVSKEVKVKTKSSPSYYDSGCGSSYDAGCGSMPVSRSSRSYRDDSCGSSSSNAGC